MTTIAMDGKTVAADSLVCFGHERGRLPAKKLVVDGGYIYAVSGWSSLIRPLIEWHKAGGDPAAAPRAPKDGFWSLAVMVDGKWFLYSSEAPYPDEIGTPFAIGAGADHATGAMWAGKSAREAVELCCQHLTHTGGEVQVIDIESVLAAPAMAEAAE